MTLESVEMVSLISAFFHFSQIDGLLHHETVFFMHLVVHTLFFLCFWRVKILGYLYYKWAIKAEVILS